MTNPDPDQTVAAQAALATVVDDWRGRHGVVSLEVARRWQGGVATNEVGIRVTVERLLPAAEVRPGELFPSRLLDIPVDVAEGSGPQLE
jgi:hypothetical protein